MAPRPRDLDVVKLLAPAGAFSAGTEGVVVAEYPDAALVEVSVERKLDEDGLPVDDVELSDVLVDVPYDQLEIVELGPKHRARAASGAGR